MGTMESPADTAVERARREYAEDLCRRNDIASPEILAAFATVPRERFAGPGPWIVQSQGEAWKTPDADPRHVYQDALIVLDAAKHLNNGQPSLWAYHLAILDVRRGDEILHLGCGTGYYTAILAELTGANGKVTAIEIDHGLAYRARLALEPWPQVTALRGDGARGEFEPVDVIVVSAGATHPLAAWLTAVKPGGKLLFPLTSNLEPPTTRHGPGTMVHLVRANADWFHAALVSTAFFVDFEGARDERLNADLKWALGRDKGAGVRSLRCDAHEKDQTCWLHGEGWCFSRLDPN
jgi:protein-L-isoaspartate(D-aspartate) O-methyltransferase